MGGIEDTEQQTSQQSYVGGGGSTVGIWDLSCRGGTLCVLQSGLLRSVDLSGDVAFVAGTVFARTIPTV